MLAPSARRRLLGTDEVRTTTNLNPIQRSRHPRMGDRPTMGPTPTQRNRHLRKGESSSDQDDFGSSGSSARNQPWTVVGKLSPTPIQLKSGGADSISRHLLDVKMTTYARKAVTGEGVCTDLNYKTQAFIHPKTARSQELIKQIVDEVRSHRELQSISFTSIQVNRNTISAPTHR